MSALTRNILAIFAGMVAGSVLNMLIIMVSGSVIAPPAGVNTADMESLKASMHLFEPKHFIFPFLAHALGTLFGAYVAARIAATHKTRLALIIGVLFLAGGLANVMMLPSPLWFTVLDLTVAYLPMAWLGGRAGNSDMVASPRS